MLTLREGVLRGQITFLSLQYSLCYLFLTRSYYTHYKIFTRLGDNEQQCLPNMGQSKQSKQVVSVARFTYSEFPDILCLMSKIFLTASKILLSR